MANPTTSPITYYCENPNTSAVRFSQPRKTCKQLHQNRNSSSPSRPHITKIQSPLQNQARAQFCPLSRATLLSPLASPLQLMKRNKSPAWISALSVHSHCRSQGIARFSAPPSSTPCVVRHAAKPPRRRLQFEEPNRSLCHVSTLASHGSRATMPPLPCPPYVAPSSANNPGRFLLPPHQSKIMASPSPTSTQSPRRREPAPMSPCPAPPSSIDAQNPICKTEMKKK